MTDKTAKQMGPTKHNQESESAIWDGEGSQPLQVFNSLD